MVGPGGGALNLDSLSRKLQDVQVQGNAKPKRSMRTSKRNSMQKNNVNEVDQFTD